MGKQLPQGNLCLNPALKHGRERRNPAGDRIIEPNHALICQSQRSGADNGFAHGGQTKTRLKAHGLAFFAVGHAHGPLVHHLSITGGHHHRAYNLLLCQGIVQHGIQTARQGGVCLRSA